MSEAAVSWQSQHLVSPEPSIDEPSEDDSQISSQHKQLYIFVARCIAYPFNAKPQLDSLSPKPKLSEASYNTICELLETCGKSEKDIVTHLVLNGSEQKCIKSQEFRDILQWFLTAILRRKEVKTICTYGGYSARELEAIFSIIVRREFSKSLHVPDYTPSMVSTKDFDEDPKFKAWNSTFEKLIELGYQRSQLGRHKMSIGQEMAQQIHSFNKEHIYAMFQNILEIQKHEHQAIYKHCQVTKC